MLFIHKILIVGFISSSLLLACLYKPQSPISVAMSQTVVLRVAMSCGGCSGAVQRALGKMEGIESFDVNLKEQKVTVTGNVQPQAVFETVAKTGKKTSFWEEPVSAPVPATETAPAAVPAPATETADPALVPATEAAPAPATEAAPAAEAAPAPALETAPPAVEAKPAESVSAA